MERFVHISQSISQALTNSMGGVEGDANSGGARKAFDQIKGVAGKSQGALSHGGKAKSNYKNKRNRQNVEFVAGKGGNKNANVPGNKPVTTTPATPTATPSTSTATPATPTATPATPTPTPATPTATPAIPNQPTLPQPGDIQDDHKVTPPDFDDPLSPAIGNVPHDFDPEGDADPAGVHRTAPGDIGANIPGEPFDPDEEN